MGFILCGISWYPLFITSNTTLSSSWCCNSHTLCSGVYVAVLSSTNEVEMKGILLRMVRWMRWHCHPDTIFENRALVIWRGSPQYWICTSEPGRNIFEGQSGRPPTFQAGNFNHCTSTPIPLLKMTIRINYLLLGTFFHIGIIPHRNFAVVWSAIFFSCYRIIQHNTSINCHTRFIERVLYFPISDVIWFSMVYDHRFCHWIHLRHQSLK